MPVNESAENYLETILILSKRLPVVRSIDIANELGFTKPSVSVAMKNLREKEHITVNDSGFITLTVSGRQIAEMIYERHQLLSCWLTSLDVSPDIAAEDACRIEHVISRESFEAIKQYVCRPDCCTGEGMTDNQLKIYNKLLQFIRKLLKLVPDDKRESLEDEFDNILQSNIEY